MKHTLSILVENRFGELARIVGLFSARGYNIDSLTVAGTVEPQISRVILVTDGSDNTIEQIVRRHEGRRQNEDVASNAADEAPCLRLRVNARAHLFFGRKGLPGIAVPDELHGTHQSRAANLADVRMALETGAQSRHQVRALARRIGDEVLFLDDPERAQRHGAPHRMPAVGVGVHPRPR